MVNNVTTTDQKTRVVFEFSERSIKEVDRLSRELDEPTRAGLVRRGLRLLAFVTEAKKAKAKFFVRYPDGRTADVSIVD